MLVEKLFAGTMFALISVFEPMMYNETLNEYALNMMMKRIG
jgi:hypothetical protein